MGEHYGNLQKIYNGRRTFGITPHIPQGFITADDLIRLGEVAKKYKGVIKITSGQRILITNLMEEDLPEIWKELKMEPAVRSQYSVKNIESCPAGFCKRHKVNTMPLANILIDEYYGKDMPNRTKIGVSGCRNACGSVYSKDVGLIADVDGFIVCAGGSAGYHPRQADIMGENLKEEEAMDLVRKILEYYRKEAEFGDKLGIFIDRIGIDTFREGVGNFDLKDALPKKE